MSKKKQRKVFPGVPPFPWSLPLPDWDVLAQKMNEGTGAGAGTAGSQTPGVIFGLQAGKAPVGVITPREKTNLEIFSQEEVGNK